MRSLGFKTIVLSVVFPLLLTPKDKKPKVNWDQGVVCAKSGVCLEEPAIQYETGSVTGIFVNNTGRELTNCMFVFPVYAGDVLVSNAQHYSFNPIAIAQKVLLHADILGAGHWTSIEQMNVRCNEGTESVKLRFPLFPDFFSQRSWRKRHQNDPDHGRDPNQ